LGTVKLTAPLPRPRRNIFCVGKNYYAHAREFAGSGFDSSAKAGGDIPSVPIIFSKVPESVIGPGDAIEIPTAVSTAIDYEAELAVIIGRGGRGIPGRRLQHVCSYHRQRRPRATGKAATSSGTWAKLTISAPWAVAVSADECGSTATQVRQCEWRRTQRRTRDLIDIPVD
jgi:hypothetical protein